MATTAPAATIDGRRRAPGQIGRTAGNGSSGSALEVWLPPLLLAVSWLLGRVAASDWLDPRAVTWALVPTAGLLVLRYVLEKRAAATGPGSRDLVALYVLHLVLVAIGTLANPLTCIYAFVGYIDGPRFLTGWTVPAVLATTALISAVGQIGGVGGIVSLPLLFALLAMVNLMLAFAMTYLAEERERIVDERERAAAELARVNRENADLHEQLVSRARESGAAEERRRLSREIHDTVAQGLVGVIRQLEAVDQDIDVDARHRITVAEEAARDSLLEARRAVEALGPHQLHDGDLVEALGELVARWARTHRVVATFDADDAPHGGRHGAVLVRITQEALANVARHAGAGTVTVTLSGTEDEHLLRICDDGIGFDPGTAEHGHGLENMDARIRQAGGTVSVLSRPGAGSTVTASVPR